MFNLRFSCALLIGILLLSSCVGNRLCPEVEIPASDSTSPDITFNIRGPGINTTFSTKEGWPNGQLNVKAGGLYNFILTSNDVTGSRLLQMQVPGEDFLIRSNIAPDRVEVRDISSLSSMLSLTNPESSPKSCLVISGRLTVTDLTSTSAQIGFGAFDFNTNVRTADLNIFIADEGDDLGFREF